MNILYTKNYWLKRHYVAFVFMLWGQTVFSQEFSVSGSVMDSMDNAALIGVNIILQQMRDTTQWKGAVSNTAGAFELKNVKGGRYLLKVSYVGYTPQQLSIVVQANVILPTMKLKPSVTTLQSVEIKGPRILVEQKGDTIQYNANGFKTSRDANAEDLITKMPGITSDNTGIKAQGENVQQVLVDGKPFFGDDPNLALKNLPAEIIDKIEVFDRLSEQAQFTGFDDGQTRKTINIVTRKGVNNGQFGRAFVGIGEDGRYTAGGNINVFKGDRRFSLLGLSNNINQQNFSSEDLLGLSGASGQGGGNRGGGRGNGSRGGGSGNNFMVGQQGGISTTNSAGFNYGDKWGKKTEVTGSYFFNKSNNEQFTDLNRTYITQQDSGLFYTEGSRSNSMNYNHRVNFRIEYAIDSSNSIIVTPRLSMQRNESRASLDGDYSSAASMLENRINNMNVSDNTGYNFSNNILYRHRFTKRGRSFSWNISVDVNNREGDTGLRSLNEYSSGETLIIDQQSDQYVNSHTISSNIAYTEPIGANGQIQVNYMPSITRSSTDKETYNWTAEAEAHTELDTLLTNKFSNTYMSNRGGLSYRYNVKKYSFMAGLNFQHAKLSGEQDFPYVFTLGRSFHNLLPQAMFNYKFAQGKNLRIMYRTATNAPSVSQLQNVVDNRNPLFLRTGNPGLKQDYSHTFTLRFNKTNIDKSSSLLFFINGNYIRDHISNTSFIATQDTVINNIFLSRGTQLSYPVNVSGYWSARTFLTFGLPAHVIKSNLNFNTGFTFNRTPAVINMQRNLANNYAVSQGLVVSSNISEKIDFTFSYTATYTIVKNTLQKQSDNNYFNQTASVRLNWQFWKGFVFNTAMNNTAYRGLSAEFNQSIWFWNAGIGYKLLKDEALEVKLNAFDILNRNSSVNREITETYIEDRQTNVLTRYFMLTLTYNLRHFN